MLLSRMVLTEILSLLVVAYYVDSKQNVVDNEDHYSHACCVQGSCSYSSLDQCLANLTSNVLINITSDVTLSSLVRASNLSNVSIIGHNYPTVNCKSVGGIYFTFCHNCTIQGITWDGCGNSVEPVLKFSHSSEVTIQNCSFQHLLGQAVMLLGVLGDANICDCNFTNNNDYIGHGAAMQFSSNDTRNSFQYYNVLTIRSCNFYYNTMKSLLYFENAKLYFVNLISSTFHRNQGISLYARNSRIYLIGRILFLNNSAESGTGIYIKDYSSVMFDKNSKVKFIQNSAHGKGGAVLLTNHSVCLFDHNSNVTFNNNYAAKGIIYSSANSNVTFKATSEITFSSNLGAAIYSANNSHVTFKGNTTVINNVIGAASYTGGVIFSLHSNISFEGKSFTVFDNNTANHSGGAITSFKYSNVSFEGNSSVRFSDNTARFGGAIYFNNSYVYFKENSSVMFYHNTATSKGGAILSTGHGNVYFEGNSTTLFINNTAQSAGGGILINVGKVFFREKSNTIFSNNIATFGGGILIQLTSNISFQENSKTVFSNNYADYSGGGIAIYNHSNVFFQENSTTVFSDNTVNGYGGGIYIGVYNNNISFQENSNTVFSNNNADFGGGVYIGDSSNMLFQKKSHTVFSNNTANYGGGIYIRLNSVTSFQGNSYTVFSNNTANYGGGIYSLLSSNIFFRERSTALFSNNIGTIYAENDCGITFDDNSTVTFNETSGVTVFSGSSSKIIAQGNFSVTFNDQSAKWCNNTCLPYDGNFDSTVIDSDGIVWCNNQRWIYCLSSKCNCKNLEDILFHAADSNNASLRINILDHVVVLSSNIGLDNDDVSIIGYNNPTVLCVNGGTLLIDRSYKDALGYSNLAIKSITWIGCGLADSEIPEFTAVLSIVNYNNVTIQKCSFQYSVQEVIILDAIGYGNIIDCKFENTGSIQTNSVKNGFAIVYSLKILVLTLKNCNFFSNKGNENIINIANKHMNTTVYLINSVFSNNKAVSVNLKTNHGSSTLYIYGEVLFENNVAENGAGISVIDNASTVIFGENSSTTFVNNSVDYNGAAMYLDHHSSAIFDSNSIVTFDNNKATNGIIYSKANSSIIFEGICHVTFSSNSATQYGSAIYSTGNSQLTFTENATVQFSDNNAMSSNGIRQGGTIFSEYSGNISFEENSNTTFNNNQADFGAAIYSIRNSSIIFKNRSLVSFNSHTVNYYGVLTTGLFSSVTFADHTNVTFNTNAVSHSTHDSYESSAGAICTFQNCNVTFSDNSLVTFINNRADRGGAVLIDESDFIIEKYSTVTFYNNFARYSSGGALVCSNNSNIVIKNNSNVTFNRNTASGSGGAIYSNSLCKITFKDNSTSTFINNSARDNGGALLIDESDFIIEKYSTVTFYNNFARYSSGGAFVCSNNSNVVIKNHSNVTFNSNKASRSGGAIYSNSLCKITFKDNSTSTFINNSARDNGGVLFSSQLCGITFEGNSYANFVNNTSDNGGALYFINFTITFKESSEVSLYDNSAKQNGGAAYCSNGIVMTEGTATIRFDGNVAENAGGLYIDMCKVTFKDASTSSFTKNNARDNGGAILSYQSAKIMFAGDSTVIFNDNKADNGGALYFANGSDGIFSKFTNVTFHHNTASYGATILANDHCDIILTGNSFLQITHNEAMQSGGGGYLNYGSNFIMQENASLTVDNNKALHGGGICIKDKTKLLFKDNSNVIFHRNVATVGGGAVKVLDDSNVTIRDYTIVRFTDNNAQYGGAIFLDTSAVMINNSDNTGVYFSKNIAELLGDSVYQETSELCNSSCAINRTLGIKSKFITTPPNELKLYQPAVCIDEDNDMQCKKYYIQGVMLGKVIAIPACVLDYYHNNHTVHPTRFSVHSQKHSIYKYSGPNEVLISCDQLKGINITSNHSLTKSKNFSMNVTLIALNANWKHLSVSLIIDLSPCHPGFWQYPNSLKCECYNDNDIVFCSDGSSMIKRGYWFGNVTGKPTVAFCPINYCNFTCCETSNGYYQLSPVRDNQCRSHRSGIACGSCEEGYALSFDSIECLDLNECTTGQTILVIALILLYWIVIIVAVFSLMRFEVKIGYFYVIAYYYSIIDLILTQNWYLSSVLNTTINVISSTAKIIPQFLGKFCFIRNMSGIDQQFIHYMHPVAVSLFIVMISVLARRSRRLSSFISKGIIHVICYLLLLSYSSVATTSLLLMRPLIFHDVDKVYTYVSPDIEYLHGRHLAYAIVAMLFGIIIVVGLPLLLGLEPFLNSKINFVKIKPLLDQFQGCYKDKYRCFAAYYMICRITIITIIIANSFNDFVLQYSLIAVCVITALIHLILKPYSNPLLNNFDGAILLLLILSSALSPFVEFIDDSDTTVFMGITFVIVMLPLLIFITMSLIINKEKIKKFPSYCYTKCLQMLIRRYNEIPLEEIEESADEEYVNVIDDSMRINATICDV